MDEFENQLIAVFNKSTLPLEAKRYVLKHVLSLVDATYVAELRKSDNNTVKDDKKKK